MLNKDKKPTLKMRLWAAVRNVPGRTGGQIVADFPNENPASITSILSHLELNDMIYSKGMYPKTYFTELEKYPVKPSAIRSKTVLTSNTIKQAEPVQVVHTTHDARIEQIFNALALPEGIALYKRLHAVFGHTSI